MNGHRDTENAEEDKNELSMKVHEMSDVSSRWRGRTFFKKAGEEGNEEKSSCLRHCFLPAFLQFLLSLKLLRIATLKISPRLIACDRVGIASDDRYRVINSHNVSYSVFSASRWLYFAGKEDVSVARSDQQCA